MSKETWVIIDSSYPSEPFYVGDGDWTTDAEKALRFASQEVAQRYIKDHQHQRGGPNYLCIRIRVESWPYNSDDLLADITRRLTWQTRTFTETYVKQLLGMPREARLTLEEGKCLARYKVQIIPLKDVPDQGQFERQGLWELLVKWGSTPKGHVLALDPKMVAYVLNPEMMVNYIVPDEDNE